MRYRLVFNKKYKVMGRYTVNMQGSLVVFTDGVAYVSNKEVADYARKLRIIESVEEIPSPVVVETKLPEPIQEVSAPEVVEEAVAVEEEEEEVSESEAIEEESASQPTADEITSVYDELGTWSAVAKHFGVSISTLRKYREDAGLL